MLLFLHDEASHLAHILYIMTDTGRRWLKLPQGFPLCGWRLHEINQVRQAKLTMQGHCLSASAFLLPGEFI